MPAVRTQALDILLTLMPQLTSLSLCSEDTHRKTELLEELVGDHPVATHIDTSLLQHCVKHMSGVLDLHLCIVQQELPDFHSLVPESPGQGWSLQALNLYIQLRSGDEEAVAASFATCLASLASMKTLQSLVLHLGHNANGNTIPDFGDDFSVNHLPKGLTKLQLKLQGAVAWEQTMATLTGLTDLQHLMIVSLSSLDHWSSSLSAFTALTESILVSPTSTLVSQKGQVVKPTELLEITVGALCSAVRNLMRLEVLHLQQLFGLDTYRICALHLVMPCGLESVCFLVCQ